MKDAVTEPGKRWRGQGKDEKKDKKGGCKNYAGWEGWMDENADCEGYERSGGQELERENSDSDQKQKYYRTRQIYRKMNRLRSDNERPG